MKTLSHLLRSLGVILLTAVIIGGSGDAGEPAAVMSPRKFPLVSIGAGTSSGAGAAVSSAPSSDRQRQSLGRARRFGRLDLTNGKNNSDAPGVTTMPHWSDSFTYNGLVYNYTMVGTDPKQGSATTVIPTFLIPLRFVFADGNVFDASTDIINGQTAIHGIVNSPIFQNYNFNTTSVKVGNTQFGDAFQRANFWDSVSTRAPNYHVILAQPTVLPTQTINVPPGLSSYFTDPTTGKIFPVVDEAFLDSQTDPILIAANVSPNTLPIMVWGIVQGAFAGAFHGVTDINGNLQTFIGTAYLPDPTVADVAPLSHEVVEWMDDPFLNNFTPGWNIPFLSPVALCDSGFSGLLSGTRDLLEVADVFEIFTESNVALPAPSFTYHVVEAAFIDFFTRASRSRSYNGQYSFFEIGLPFGLPTLPSSACTGHVEYTPTFVDFPGATFTTVSGLNSHGTAVGYYSDAAGAQHGFVFSGSKYSSLDYPGSLQTVASKINDTGTIVGTFVDGSFGTHGFSYANGKWTQLDFPGSFDTEPSGINTAGDIVGTYDGSQPITHGFVLHNRQYQRIDTPFGTQAQAFAINDLGAITGIGYTDPTSFDSSTAFIATRKGFSAFQFPGSIFTGLLSINNSNDLAGGFFDSFGNFWGMVTVSGIPYQVVNAGVVGNDNFDRICGYAFDFDARRWRGFIGTLPLQQNAH